MLPKQGCMINMLIIFLVVKGQNYSDIIITPDTPSCLNTYSVHASVDIKYVVHNMKALCLKTNMFSQGQSCIMKKKKLTL